MADKHQTVPWYGASEKTQASLLLQSLWEEVSTTIAQKVKFKLPSQEEISTVPLKPTVVEEPPEESLPYTGEEGEETTVTFDIDPEDEQELLGAEEEKDGIPRHRSPSLLDIQEASARAPSDTKQYEYARNVQGTMESRYFKGDDPSQGFAVALVKQDLPSSSGDPSGPPPLKKPKANK